MSLLLSDRAAALLIFVDVTVCLVIGRLPPLGPLAKPDSAEPTRKMA